MHMSLVTLTTPPAALGQNGFANSDFDFQLKQRGLAKIIVVGTLASTSVEATARSGGELGYHLTIGARRDNSTQAGGNALLSTKSTGRPSPAILPTGAVIAAPVRPRAARLPSLVL